MTAFRTTLIAFALCSCQTEARFAPQSGDTPAACEARRQELVRFVKELPERSLGADLRADLPASTLGAAPGTGPVLVVTEQSLSFDGQALTPEAWTGRAAELPAQGPLYVAAAPDVTIRTLRAAVAPAPRGADLKLLIRTAGKAHALAADAAVPDEARELAGKLLAENDPARQKALAERGYAQFSACQALNDGVAGVGTRAARERWPALKGAFDGALPSCPCGSLDAPALRALLAAEQRAGTATLGVLPLSFVRDERCDATMGLRSVKRLLEQMEKFDADNAGSYAEDAVRFEQVVTNERLREQFCDALPGETLAALSKAKRPLFFRTAGAQACEAWKFEPIARGAPMGTLRRTGAGDSGPAALHYWQAAEELDLFGPAEPDSKPTDTRAWTCRSHFRFVGIDADSIVLENGRWFFSEAACRNAPPEAAAPPACAPQPAPAPTASSTAATPAAAPPAPAPATR